MHALSHILDSNAEQNAKLLACAIVSSSVDCYNALLTEMTENNFSKLLRVPNTRSRVVTAVTRRDHTTPAILTLH